MKDLFHRISQKTSTAMGRPLAFFSAVLIILLWGATGPLFRFSDTWQLVINTGTTIVTFLMVFLIQNTQNRDAKVMHLKLDELIRATGKARNMLVDLEDLTDAEIDLLDREFKSIQQKIVSGRKRKLGRDGRSGRASGAGSIP